MSQLTIKQMMDYGHYGESQEDDVIHLEYADSDVVSGQFDDADCDAVNDEDLKKDLNDSKNCSNFKKLTISDFKDLNVLDNPEDDEDEDDNFDDDDDDIEQFHRVSRDFNVQTQNASQGQLHTQVNKISIGESKRGRRRDKSQQATVEQVLDPRTRMILYRLLSKGTLLEINGAISTGKEANVYHATAKDGTDKAIKIYKTSILIFKDRDRYVTGEFRFRHGYCKSNPRKMVRLWAEKEMRNLTRMHKAQIPCPEPILLKNNVLLMSFIGEDGVAAPLLKDATFPDSKARELYLDIILMVRRLYHECKLIHGDLSEFNMLYFKGKAYIIDVSQSVEHEHPHAMEFLRKDLANITDFFRRKNVPTMTVKELFEFVTDSSITTENIDAYLEQAMKISSERSAEEISEQEKIDEEVFKRSFIPRTLDEVVDIERDFRRTQTFEGEQVLYHTVTGLKPDLSGPSQVPLLLEQVTGQNEEDDDDEEDEEDQDSHNEGGKDEHEKESLSDYSDNGNDGESNNKSKKLHPVRQRNETAEEKKERKKLVKDSQKEKRQTKIPKHIKKRQVKLGAAKK
ncbi:serine/threonine-protein kinase RIO1-like isoform X1 [Biomphalaria glabrata]|uniref:Serine/threonine-protein kinase RIO1 n=1 Tax=Biomphalaria glabrata TaxID=6526 RepID=A0A9W3AG09_BIOGL|nr:serine/threonine-protein kinase RIO1-like isoform X1 [Biomphalaria glabrata]XP_055886101.1 serine/threonine-protein kinase RIO1-like isoform X1 [Biomphalaria glabrata]